MWFLYRFIPIGKHTINIIKIDKKSREIISNKHNKRITMWNHYIKMKKVSANITKYTDSIALYAGYRTPFVAGGLSNFINTDKKKADNYKKIIVQL